MNRLMSLERQKMFVEIFGEIAKIFEQHNIQYWLSAGTCICAYRDGHLTHEHDFDFGMFVEDVVRVRRLLPLIKKSIKGCEEINEFSYNGGKNVFQHSFKIVGNEIVKDDKVFLSQIYYHYEVGNYRVLLGETLPFSIPKYYFNSFKKIKFFSLNLDYSFYVPEKTEEYLEWFFGKDWRTPLISYEYFNYQKQVLNGTQAPFPVNERREEIMKFLEDFKNNVFDGSKCWRKK